MGQWRKDDVLELPKGGNTAVVGPVIRSTLQTRLVPGEIDICALLVNQQRRTRSDEDFVFFNQKRSRCGSTRRLSDVEIEVDLRQVPAAVDAIVIAASLDATITGSVASHGGGRILVADAASTIVHTLAGLTSERCVIVAELYRRAAGWKLRAVSQGFPDLAGLIAVFGVDTEDDHSDTARPAPHTGSPARTPRPPAGTSGRVPPETREILDRVRAGAAARRASVSSPFPLPSWRPHRPRRGATPAQQRAEYKAERHREAAHITAGIEQQNQQVEAILHQLPHTDLGTHALLGLIDASVPPPAAPRLRLFRRSEPAPPPLPPPSSYLQHGLHRLRQAASRLHHRDAVHAWL